MSWLELFGLDFGDDEVEAGFFALKPKKCQTRRSAKYKQVPRLRSG